MSTLRKQKLERLLKQRSIRLANATKMKLPAWKGLLIGFLMICVTTISGCVSESRILVPPQEVSVDASLMVEPNLTNEMLSVFSQ